MRFEGEKHKLEVRTLPNPNTFTRMYPYHATARGPQHSTCIREYEQKRGFIENKGGVLVRQSFDPGKPFATATTFLPPSTADPDRAGKARSGREGIVEEFGPPSRYCPAALCLLFAPPLCGL